MPAHLCQLSQVSISPAPALVVHAYEWLDMEGFAKLWASIIHSSLWKNEDKDTRLLFVTMLAMADQNGYVGSSLPGLAAAVVLDLKSTEAALKRLEAADEYSRDTAHGGRRVKKVHRGWMILNYTKHRDGEQKRARRREQLRKAQKTLRDKRKLSLSTVIVGNQPSSGVNSRNQPSSGQEIEPLSNKDLQEGVINSLSKTSSYADADADAEHTSYARKILADFGMDDGGWRTVKDKVKTTAEILLLIEWAKSSKRVPGGIINHIRNGYAPPKVIPPQTLFRWVTKLRVVKSVCGQTTNDQMKFTMGEVIIGPQRARVKDSELTPQSIVFKETPCTK